MMYIQSIRNVLAKQTPSQPEQVESLVLRMIEFQKIQPQSKLHLQSYSHLKFLSIIKCDLRTLQNFPYIQTLVDLRLNDNKLQGTLENIIKLIGLEYLDLSNNIIRDVSKLIPLKRMKKLVLYIAHNPFEKVEGWKTELGRLNLKIINEQKRNYQQEEESIVLFNPKKQQKSLFTTNTESVREKLTRLDKEREELSRELYRNNLTRDLRGNNLNDPFDKNKLSKSWQTRNSFIERSNLKLFKNEGSFINNRRRREEREVVRDFQSPQLLQSDEEQGENIAFDVKRLLRHQGQYSDSSPISSDPNENNEEQSEEVNDNQGNDDEQDENEYCMMEYDGEDQSFPNDVEQEEEEQNQNKEIQDDY